MDILIIGLGFVGKAVQYAFDIEGNTVRFLDPKYSLTTLNSAHYEWKGWTPDFTFICVATPTTLDGCHTEVLASILERHKRLYPHSQVVIKSTVTPDRLEELRGIDDRFVYNPEFLRADHAFDDILTPKIEVYGGDNERAHRVAKLFSAHSKCATGKQIFCQHTEASLFKYAVNSFLAVKVGWANEMYDLFAESGTTWEWNTFATALGYEPRVGTTHLAVPGTDGEYGFGGSCLPKDLDALISYAASHEVTPDIMIATAESNNHRRK